MPGGPEWFSKTFNLPESPKESHTLYYRDAIMCAKALFENPAYKESMLYAPMKVYDDKGRRVFSEMPSGNDWHELQVCPSR
jgi:hypothetical protein